ncbi:MAG: hypothetical protein ACKVS6_09910, partial [Planctomycetota bacterium]
MMRFRILLIILVVLVVGIIVSFVPGVGGGGGESEMVRNAAESRERENVNIGVTDAHAESVTSRESSALANAAKRERTGERAAAATEMTVRGRIVTSTGVPIENANVQFDFVLYSVAPSTDAKPPGACASDSAGLFTHSFALECTEDDRLYYQITAAGYTTLRGISKLHFPAGADGIRLLNLETITMTRGAAVRGKLLLSDGSPFGDGGSIHFRLLMDHVLNASNPTPIPIGEFMSNADTVTGEFVLNGVRPGMYQIFGGAWRDEWFEAPSMLITTDDIDNYEFRTPVAARKKKNTGSFTVKLLFPDKPPPGWRVSFASTSSSTNTPFKPKSENGNEYTFEELPAGGGVVFIDGSLEDPNFPYTPTDIEISETIGQVITVELKHVGYYSFLPRVIDFETRQIIPNAKIGVDSMVRNRYSANAPITITKNNTWFYVFADGYEFEILDMRDRDLDQLKNIEVALHRTATISGKVRYTHEQQSFAGAFVSVRQISSVREQSLQFSGMPSGDISHDGTFSISGITPGEYSIFARQKYMTSEEIIVNVTSGQELKNIELVIPNWTRVTGKIINLINTSLLSCNTRVVDKDNQFVALGNLRPDGTFIIDGLRRKLYKIQLQLPKTFEIQNIAASDNASFVIPLGDLDLTNAGDELSVAYDLTETSPSMINILLTINGRPEPSYCIIASRWLGETRHNASGCCAADGIVKIGPVAAGDLHLDILHPKRHWGLPLPDPVAVAAGANVTIPVDIIVRDATLRIENAKGEVLKNKPLTIQYYWQG